MKLSSASHTRRQFLKTSAFVGATFAIGGTKSSGNVLGSNERVRIAVAGLNGRGQSHLDGFSKNKGSEVTYVVDPDQRTHTRSIEKIKKDGGNTPTALADIRKVLEDPNVDAISVATPNHWHALMTIWGCQAGKDVYVEKPCSHNIHEGAIAVQAAEKYKRIVQHGTQNRSNSNWWKAVAAVHSGEYGKLKTAYGYCYKKRGSIGMKEVSAPPADLDFNIWLGPAPEQPYHGNLVHYNWHWFWDTGNGDIGNQGVHQMDVALWGIKDATWPKSVTCVGGRFGYTDQGQTPNTQIALFDYGETKLIFEVRGLQSPSKVDNMFVLEEGTIKQGKFFPNGKTEGEPIVEKPYTMGPGGGDHFGNFVEAVKSRKVGDLNAPITVAHYSSGLCHLANNSFRLGKDEDFGPADKAFKDSPVAADSLSSMEEHLVNENGLKLNDIKCRVGRTLALTPDAAKFFADPQANALYSREYRKPFAVPEKV
jgi:predicted dehydrogenase